MFDIDKRKGGKMTDNEHQLIRTLLWNSDPSMAITRVSQYLKDKKLNTEDFRAILGTVNLFFIREIVQTRRRILLIKIELAMASISLVLAILAIIIRVCL